MNENQINIIISDKTSQDEVALPVDREQLGTFISNLLGQQQTIEREIYGSFCIDLSWLIHINALIDQRIKQQNHSTLTAFNATIYYENSMKRTISSIEAFEHFSETKKVKSQGIKVTWTYLISFPGKELPEKQEISLYASSKAPVASRPEDPVRRMFSSKHQLGVISYSISHTERTWGDDIEVLLKNELDLILQEESWLGNIMSPVLGIMGLIFMFGVTFILPEIMNTIIQSNQIDLIYKHYPEIISLKIANITDIGTKLDLILKAINPNNSIHKLGIGYRVLMVISGLAMGFWCFYLTEKVKPSFVVLSRESQEQMDRILAREKRNYILVIVSFIASITTGVIGNYIYFILST